MLRKHEASGTASAAAASALLAIAAVVGRLNFARWDNTETFLPSIWYTHNELLHGRLPLWNPLQHLGEPIHALGAGATLYLPYTFCVALTQTLHWPEARTLDVSAVMHVALGSFAMAKLASELGIRRSIACAAGISTMLSGFAMAMGSMWVHVIPNLAWSIWAMWGIRRTVMNDRGTVGAAVAAVSLGIVFHTGHIQMSVNIWLACWLWTLALMTALRMWPLRRLALSAVAAILIALPAILPTALVFPDSDRVQEHVTAGTPFSVRAILLGSIWPGLAGDDRVVARTGVVTPFIALWLVPAIVAGAVCARRRAANDLVLVRVFIATICTALFFVWLNMGPTAGVYWLLHSVPVLSKFSFAFKYWERAVPLLALAGAIGLELAARRWTARWVQLIVPLSLVGAAMTIWIAHSPARINPYLIDRGADARLNFAQSSHRVLPLSPRRTDNAYMRPLSLFYAASLDGYESATGHRFALTSSRTSRNFPADVAGVPDRTRLPIETLITSNWVRLADVGHFIVAHDDAVATDALADAFPNAQFTETRYARIVHIDPNWPRVFFATAQLPGNAASIHEILFTKAPISAAAVEGDPRRRALPAGKVERAEWDNESISVDVNAPEGGLLVFSLGYSHEWQAQIDNQPAQPMAVDGMFTGLWVGPGATRVELHVRRWPLNVGLLAAFCGFSVALAPLLLNRAPQP